MSNFSFSGSIRVKMLPGSCNQPLGVNVREENAGKAILECIGKTDRSAHDPGPKHMHCMGV
jgi:hypothetical protein